MSDSFLRSHRHSTGVYTLANRTPLSIRDQLVRAHYLFNRLWSSGQLSAKKSICVVGAGAAGSTIATLAARAGVDVTLVDAGPAAFYLQLHCTTRHVDPVQYDWPLSHCREEKWPVDSPRLDVPFGFEAGTAAKIAGKWNARLSAERARPNFKVFFDTRLRKMPAVAGKSIHIDIDQGSRPIGLKVDVVVLAYGMASERTSVPIDQSSTDMLTALPFWKADKFQDAYCGIRPSARIAISGGGDGALQDYIRLSTGYASAIAFLDGVFKKAGVNVAVLDPILAKLQEVEGEAERVMLWSNGGHHDHDALGRIQNAHVEAISSFAAAHSAEWQKVVYVIAERIARRDMRLGLFFPCDHFSACYPLNRFTVLLIDSALKEVGAKGSVVSSHLYPGKALIAASTPAQVPHECDDSCWGKTVHHCLVVQAPHCNPASFGNSGIPFDVDGVVIRHGINKHTRAGWHRQILPRHI